MGAIQEIFCEFGPEYLERFGQRMPASHRKTIHSIIHCRKSANCGYSVYACPQCHVNHFFDGSCGNRNCPTCQGGKNRRWFEEQVARKLPTHYFLITFTVPQELRPFMRSNQEVAYGALFRASSEALKKLARDPKFIGADQVGSTGVLQTWGRQMQYHPHIHYVVPGGGLNKERTEWLPSGRDFYVPVMALSPIVRAKFRDEMKKAGLFEQIDPEVWHKGWNVDSEAVGDADQSLEYLSRYVFRVAISDHRVVQVKDGKVTFLYRDKETRQNKTCTLEALEFIRRYLQHVLPKGFMKVRHYGFLSRSSGVSFEDLWQRVVEYNLSVGEPVILTPPEQKRQGPPTPRCPTCGTPLVRLAVVVVTSTGLLALPA